MIKLPIFVYVIGLFLLPVIAIAGAGTGIAAPLRIGALAGFMLCGLKVLAWLRSPR